ncbi:bacteriophage holin [Halocalculus aciditolerans]|uniref:Uncharacterized protein n=1 Tax=Halocalculus aciditolerans TaxID=1383812 RepID=A0A830FDV8_9EURY|nr:bacteriophage holin [Halocalculus aciditolerans]GGL65426.1 hypothetical protein GCM10009039_24110 [Halocalculus aciditolerans]
MTDDSPIDRVALGGAIALVWAGYVGLVGLLARVGWGERWRSLLSDVYVGFDETTSGIAVGIGWAAIDGFLAGWTVATAYDALTPDGAGS